MKRTISLFVIVALLLAGCGRPQYLGSGADRKYYPTYGIANESSSKSKNVCYELSAGNIIWSIILLESVIFPAYFIGWSLYNPVRLKTSPTDDCTYEG